MKTTWFKSALILTTLALFAVGCGKDGGGGSSSSSNYLNYDPNNGLDQYGQAAIAAANNWYGGVVEGQQGIASLIQVERYQITSTQNSSNCETKKFLGIPYTYCTNSSSNTSAPQGTKVFTTQVNTRANNNIAISAKQNDELRKVFTKASGELVSATQSGNEIKLAFLNSSSGIVTTYTINTSYHSQLNPIRIDTQNFNTREVGLIYTYAIPLYP